MIRSPVRFLKSTSWMVLGAALALSPARAADAPVDSSARSLSLGGGRLFTMEGRSILFSRLSLDPMACDYVPKGRGEREVLSADRILRIEQETGSEAARWGVGLGLSGLLGGLLAVATAGSNSNGGGKSVSSGTKAAVVAATTGVCALIGVLVGASHKTYTAVYTNPRFQHR